MQEITTNNVIISNPVLDPTTSPLSRHHAKVVHQGTHPFPPHSPQHPPLVKGTIRTNHLIRDLKCGMGDT